MSSWGFLDFTDGILEGPARLGGPSECAILRGWFDHGEWERATIATDELQCNTYG